MNNMFVLSSVLLALIATGASVSAESTTTVVAVQKEVQVTSVEYADINDPSFPLLGYVSIPQSAIDNDEQLPAVVILPVSQIKSSQVVCCVCVCVRVCV